MSLGKRVVVEESDDTSDDDRFDENLGYGDNKVRDWHNKQRVLMCLSRGIASKQRHMMQDLLAFLAHAKKENKIEKMGVADQIKTLTQANSCNNLLFFEQRKSNTFLWMGKSPNGPSCNFKIENVTTTNELQMIGNCLKYSRAVLSFDKSFDEEPHLQIYKEILTDTFGVPKNHPKSKPFIDHMFCFYWVDNRIWFRHYQLFRQAKLDKDLEELDLVEIGPRFSLSPIKIFDGFMGGEVLYANKYYIAPMQAKREMQVYQAKRFLDKLATKKRKGFNKKFTVPRDQLDEVFDEIDKYEKGEIDNFDGKQGAEFDDEEN